MCHIDIMYTYGQEAGGRKDDPLAFSELEEN